MGGPGPRSGIMSGSEGATTATADDSSLPWTAVPKFVPGVTDMTEYSRKMQFLAQIWPKEHLSASAPRAALLCEGAAFKKVSRLNASKLRVNDESGIQLLVTTLGGAWGQIVLEEKYEQFERAVYGTTQRADETDDSYLARRDVHFEELLAQEISFEALRSYILLRQSQLSSEDKKRIVIERSGKLSYEKVKSSIRLLGSKFFQDMQNHRGSTRTKTYDVNYSEPAEPEEASSFTASRSGHAGGDEREADLEPEYVEALAAQEDQDALTITAFEGELEDWRTPASTRVLHGGSEPFARKGPI